MYTIHSRYHLGEATVVVVVVVIAVFCSPILWLYFGLYLLALLLLAQHSIHTIEVAGITTKKEYK